MAYRGNRHRVVQLMTWRLVITTILLGSAALVAGLRRRRPPRPCGRWAGAA